MFICEIKLFDWYFPQFCTSDISKCLRGSLRLRESTVYLRLKFLKPAYFFRLLYSALRVNGKTSITPKHNKVTKISHSSTACFLL